MMDQFMLQSIFNAVIAIENKINARLCTIENKLNGFPMNIIDQLHSELQFLQEMSDFIKF
jgi:hypothetical protein